MTTTELIHDVAEDIVIQQSQMAQLKKRGDFLLGMFWTSTACMSASMLIAASTSCILLLALIATVAWVHMGFTKKETAHIKVLLDQSLFYRNFLIEEFYSGKNMSPEEF